MERKNRPRFHQKTTIPEIPLGMELVKFHGGPAFVPAKEEGEKLSYMKYNKAVCILGGMGPQASIYLYKILIEISERCFGAKNNDDYPELVLYSVPVPDFISNDLNRDKALEMLKQKVCLIDKNSAVCVSIACNTAHILLPELQKISKVPFVSMIEETAKQIHKDGKKKVGLLGTPSTIKYGLYQNALKKNGISAEIPSQKQIEILDLKVIQSS